MATTLVACINQMFVFNKICWVMFFLKSSNCGKIFIATQVVLNVWKQFEVRNSDFFALQ